MDTISSAFAITHTAGLTSTEQVISQTLTQTNGSALTETWLTFTGTTGTVSIIANSAIDSGSFDYTLTGSLADLFNSVQVTSQHIDIVSYRISKALPAMFYLVGAKTFYIADAFEFA